MVTSEIPPKLSIPKFHARLHLLTHYFLVLNILLRKAEHKNNLKESFK